MSREFVNIDIFVYLAEAISTNKLCYGEIDKIYNKDAYLFDKIFEESKFKKHTVARQGTLIQDYYFKKIAALLIYYKDTDGTELVNIIKAGFKYPYTYIEQRKELKLSEFMQALVKKRKGIDNISDVELNSYFLVVILLAQFLEKDLDIEDDFYNLFIKTLVTRETKDSIDIFNAPIDKDSMKEINFFKQQVKNRKNITLTEVLSSKKIHIENLEGIMFDVDLIEEENKFFLIYESVFDKFVNGTALDITQVCSETPLTEKELNSLIHLYLKYYYRDDKEVNYDEFEKFLFISIPIVRLLKAYANAKEFTLENIEQSKNQKINELNEVIKNKDNEIERLKRELEELKVNKRKEELLAQNQKDTLKELHSLREYVFNNSQDDDEEIACDVDTLDQEKIQQLNEIKGVIVGGFSSWQKRLQEKLPGWTFISKNNYHFDTRILKNADFVFINTRHIGHSLYYKVIENIGESEFGLIKNKNINISLTTMYSNIFKSK